MSGYPPEKWEIRLLEDLATFTPTFPEPWRLGTAVILAVKPANGAEGTFQVVLGGSQHVEVKFLATNVISHSALEGFELRGQFEPGESISFQPNSTCSTWVDFREMVAGQDLDAYSTTAGELATEAFLAALDAARTKKQPIGAAFRWAATIADGARNIEIQLQALPGSGTTVNAQPLLR
jgi:hypothetical protein